MLKESNIKQCTIALLHDTPLPSSQTLFKSFHLVNQEWPLTNSGALLQRLRLIGSSQILWETTNNKNDNNKDIKNNLENENIHNSKEITGNNSSILIFNKPIQNSKKTDFQIIYKNIPINQISCCFPFSVVAYLEETKNSLSNHNENIDNIKIIGHSRWALAKPLFSKTNNANNTQVLMDSLVVDKEYRNYGIGKAILLYGEEILKRMKVNQIYLQTKHAENFYLKYGYEKSKIIPIIKIEKKIYDNIPLDDKEIDKIIEIELSSKKELKPRPFNFSNAVWMEKNL
ncbi:hypothetical protein BCR32DRAFT_270782 [Anaeromyces robustus]|uniref:N-acetyltransferase domain-containing protein n=1 Tax=Anaeromyces robustus TaxID=1754192 RepID=A0A1Y1WUK3_9FUNG|nr:hypothetical protein BCR32DRAFT_270782 [Anaeromyces robustus]|eukprot:ORX77239.1 hypothetical protein BCR32DRAFT_270782 [Anaeromyces robustus]